MDAVCTIVLQNSNCPFHQQGRPRGMVGLLSMLGLVLSSIGQEDIFTVCVVASPIYLLRMRHPAAKNVCASWADTLARIESVSVM